MLLDMITRNGPRKLKLMAKLPVQLGVIIVLKIVVLLGLWYLLLKDHKVQSDSGATAEYFLTTNAKPLKQVTPKSPWE